MSQNSKPSLFHRAIKKTKSFFSSFSVEDELMEFEQEITAKESNDHIIIDMSDNNSTTATPITDVAAMEIDSTATVTASVTATATSTATPNNNKNVSPATNLLADYYAALLNGTPAATATATLAAAASPNKPAPRIPSLKRCDFAKAWGSYKIPSADSDDTFWYFDEESDDDEDKNLTWDEAFNTYEFSIPCSGNVPIEKKTRKRKSSSDDNKIPLSSLQIVKRQRRKAAKN